MDFSPYKKYWNEKAFIIFLPDDVTGISPAIRQETLFSFLRLSRDF